MDRNITVGVVAVQGAFEEHCTALDKLGVYVREIRSPSDLLTKINGMVFPGGESTAQGKLLRESGLFDIMLQMIKDGLPVYGTCAGMVLLAKHIENDERKHFAVMDITVKRNAYGRQLGSFMTTGDFGGIGKIPMYFIRAPYISSAGKDVTILSRDENGAITAAREANMLVTSFHPEVTDDLTVHSYFLSMI
ncbi:MAG: pyridoxal 5'-phosphate synthase glutaminase subunit PdxT [Synergistaceae bacterium]|nr:pyridoxal 5'-phosphate synthase glutaminase subunit PdxT [Synergistaceae bacterium]